MDRDRDIESDTSFYEKLNQILIDRDSVRYYSDNLFNAIEDQTNFFKTQYEEYNILTKKIEEYFNVFEKREIFQYNDETEVLTQKINEITQIYKNSNKDYFNIKLSKRDFYLPDQDFANDFKNTLRYFEKNYNDLRDSITTYEEKKLQKKREQIQRSIEKLLI